MNSQISNSKQIKEFHKELWETINSYDVADYVVENIIPEAMQIAGRMANIVDVISPNWKDFVYQTNAKADGQWLFNDLFSVRITKILKELKKDYSTPDALAKLMNFSASNIVEIIGGACGKPCGKSPNRRKKKIQKFYEHNKVPPLDLHWANMLLLIIVNWEYIWRISAKDKKMYHYTRSIFWLNDALSDLSQPKGGYERNTKLYKPLKDWCISRAYEMRNFHPSYSKARIAMELWDEMEKNKQNWERQGCTLLTKTNALYTIQNDWLPKGKPQNWPSRL